MDARSRPWRGPTGRPGALAAAVGLHLLLFAVLVLTAFAMPTVKPPWLPTLGASLVNAVVLVAALAVVALAGWGRETGVTVGRVNEPWLLLPPLVISAAWVGFEGVDTAAVLPVAVRMLFVGAAEEIIYRGLVLRLLRPWGVVGACVLSAVIFGVGHIGNTLFFGQPWPSTVEMMVVATLFGLVYAPLRLRVGAVWPLALLHAFTNTTETVAVARPPLWFTAIVGVAALGYAWLLLRGLRDPHRSGVPVR